MDPVNLIETLANYVVENVEEGHYEIHDYKTSIHLPLPAYFARDRQLALYLLGVKDAYPDTESIRLIWHFLAFDKEL